MDVFGIERFLISFLAASAASAAPFWVRVVDDASGRGVPLVQLSTPRDAIGSWADSNGVARLTMPHSTARMWSSQYGATVTNFRGEF